MRKICIVVGSYPIDRGGAEYQAYLLAQKLGKRSQEYVLRHHSMGANIAKIVSLFAQAR